MCRDALLCSQICFFLEQRRTKNIHICDCECSLTLFFSFFICKSYLSCGFFDWPSLLQCCANFITFIGCLLLQACKETVFEIYVTGSDWIVQKNLIVYIGYYLFVGFYDFNSTFCGFVNFRMTIMWDCIELSGDPDVFHVHSVWIISELNRLSDALIMFEMGTLHCE